MQTANSSQITAIWLQQNLQTNKTIKQRKHTVCWSKTSTIVDSGHRFKSRSPLWPWYIRVKEIKEWVWHHIGSRTINKHVGKQTNNKNMWQLTCGLVFTLISLGRREIITVKHIICKSMWDLIRTVKQTLQTHCLVIQMTIATIVLMVPRCNMRGQ